MALAPIADLIARTTVSPCNPANPHLNFDPDQPDRLTVRLADGSVEEARVAFPLGALQNPMDSAEILRKFADNVYSTTADSAVRALVGWPDAPDLVSFLSSWR